jgi:hypothetical protein
VVLVARRGEAVSDLTATLQTLHAFGAGPVWALLIGEPPTRAAAAASETARSDNGRTPAAPRPRSHEAVGRYLSRVND